MRDHQTLEELAALACNEGMRSIVKIVHEHDLVFVDTSVIDARGHDDKSLIKHLIYARRSRRIPQGIMSAELARSIFFKALFKQPNTYVIDGINEELERKRDSLGNLFGHFSRIGGVEISSIDTIRSCFHELLMLLEKTRGSVYHPSIEERVMLLTDFLKEANERYALVKDQKPGEEKKSDADFSITATALYAAISEGRRVALLCDDIDILGIGSFMDLSLSHGGDKTENVWQRLAEPHGLHVYTTIRSRKDQGAPLGAKAYYNMISINRPRKDRFSFKGRDLREDPALLRRATKVYQQLVG